MRNDAKLRFFISAIITCCLAFPCHAKSAIIISSDSMISTTYDSYENCQRKNTFVLNCPSYQQTTNYTCGPAVIMDLLLYYNKINRATFSRETELRIAKEMHATPGEDGGTSTTQMIDWLRSNGFHVSYGRDVSSRLLMDNIKRGHPVILSVDNHWILAKGFSQKSGKGSTDEFIFSDSCCGSRTIASSYIDSMWAVGHMKNKFCGAMAGTYIIATPK